MSVHRFRASVQVDQPPEVVFGWHERAGAIERLTPPWQPVRVVARRGGIRDGDRVTMRVRVAGLQVTWVAEHRDYVAGQRFRDVQLHGPFRRWEHTHRFEPTEAGGCVMTDEIEYELPGGALGDRLGEAYAEQRLQRVFAWRHALLARDLAMHRDWAGGRRISVLMAGASGLVGSALLPLLTTGGHRVFRLVRREPTAADEIAWSPNRGELDGAALAGVTAGDGEAGVDAVVNLAGEPVFARWTGARKRRIRDSRVMTTRTLAGAVAGAAGLERRPAVMLNASGVNAYGDRGQERVDESSERGTGFLAETCRAWEGETQRAADAGVRVVLARFGIVLSPAGGAIANMLPIFRLGLGGRLGGGGQWWSWISLEDAARAIYFALVNDALAGPVNVVSPGAVTNQQFTRSLGRTLGRPTMLPAPAMALRLALGQMAQETMLASMRVAPARLAGAGFDWVHAELDGALADLLGRPG
ncbi:MAG: TIGR01777 family oxidoreductase [Phycisphaeraceae bacterium]